MHSKHSACEDLSTGTVAPEAERRCWAASAVLCGEVRSSALSVVVACGRARARPSVCGPFVGGVRRPACRHRVCGSTHSSASIPRRVSRVMWSQWTIWSRQIPSSLLLPSLSEADLSGQAPPVLCVFSEGVQGLGELSPIRSGHRDHLETKRQISDLGSAKRREGQLRPSKNLERRLVFDFTSHQNLRICDCQPSK